ncbi:protein LHCP TRANSLOCATION DEFECT [Artemisia annua]|uniref:Protein LHCP TRANSLOCATION DEFECT n=1 Tax=Artemisia annua TaxID=35608 RepID=A0A2U1MY30_ARTAN|nr:protein LHCP TRANSLOCATION DEFECT [Artemisia annua]
MATIPCTIQLNYTKPICKVAVVKLGSEFMGGMGKRVGFSRRIGVSNGSRSVCWFKFGKNGVDAEGAGIYGSQSLNDFDHDDVEQDYVFGELGIF